MDIMLTPRPIGGTISTISSKSHGHRLLICAALSNKETFISCNHRCDDLEATVSCLNALGARISYEDGGYAVCPIGNPSDDPILDCRESGATLRFLLPVAAALGKSVTFRLNGRLAERPLSPLVDALEAHGCHLFRPDANTLRCSGKLRGGNFSIPGDVSSQFVSGLLFALPLIGEDCDIMLTSSVESVGYISMTLEVLKAFGIHCTSTDHGWRLKKGQSYQSPGNCIVEGDWSNAAFWLCAGGVSRPVSVTGLASDSAQGDRLILSILEAFGAQVQWQGSTVTVSPGALHCIDLDVRHIPDLVPPVALVASAACGTTVIHGGKRLRNKESDRLVTIAQTLNQLGGQVQVTDDGLIIHGCPLVGGELSSHNDHRIAMLGALASALCPEPVVIHEAQAVNKSYPHFWKDLKQLQQEGRL